MTFKKIGILFLTVFATPVIAGLYGIIHDQLTYTISPEYFTKFKFIQFHIPEDIYNRIGVSIVGWYATWWTGLIIGLILGMLGLIHHESKMLKIISKSILLTLLVAFSAGLTGLAFGKFYLAEVGVSWTLPGELEDKENFIAVGSMHNFSYLGGSIGLICGIVYQIRQKAKKRIAL